MPFSSFIRNMGGVKQIDRFLISFSNISRGLFVSIIGLLINYILVHYKANAVLDGYVYCITLVNLLFVFCNWGGKDHSIQVMAQNTSAFSETFSLLLISRFLLFVPAFIPVLFLPVSLTFKCFIGFYLFLKVTGSFLESVITVQKKFHRFLLIDVVLNTLLVGLLLLDHNYDRPEIFLAELSGIELLRTAICFIFFGKHVTFKVRLKKVLLFLKESRHFFYIALSGFLCSKADLYVVGLLLNIGELSRYFIILNLVILGQIVFHTFISTFRANILRYNEQSFTKFRKWSDTAGSVYAVVCAAAIYVMCSFYYDIPLGFLFTALVAVNILFFTFICTHVLAYTRLNKQRSMATIIFSAGIFNVLLSLPLTHFFGITGAFMSNTLALIFNFVLFTKYDRLPNQLLKKDL